MVSGLADIANEAGPLAPCGHHYRFTPTRLQNASSDKYESDKSMAPSGTWSTSIRVARTTTTAQRPASWRKVYVFRLITDAGAANGDA